MINNLEKYREAGMDAHLSKPIETEVLYRTLSDVLDMPRG